MRACVLHGIGHLRFENVSTPTRRPGEVLVRIEACGICGSDLPRVFEKGTYTFPTIPGHEFAGVICETEEKDAALLGKRVAVFPLLPCRRCAACEIGEYAQCADYNYFGSRCDGGFAEYISVPLFNLVMAPEGLSAEAAAMCEPAAVALHAIRQAQIEPGNTVAIFGAGPIGLLLAQWATASGAARVVLFDIDQSKLDFSISLGWSHSYNSMTVNPTEILRNLTDGQGADVAIEGAGAGKAWEQCLYGVRSFGTVVAMGNPAGDMHLSQKAYWEILRKQLTLRGTWNSSYNSVHNDWKTALEAMLSGRIDPLSLITHRYTLEECPDAFQMIRERKTFNNKVMILTEK